MAKLDVIESNNAFSKSILRTRKSERAQRAKANRRAIC
jgi:hypothetical protein